MKFLVMLLAIGCVLLGAFCLSTMFIPFFIFGAWYEYLVATILGVVFISGGVGLFIEVGGEL